ncbi:hypothetical protein AAMO2058_001357500 [Amorphochlora amoebiformis]|uniref:peptidylprolyl isomerase n=1 Tax=Amorphochlora amoebiformis TaxID=1561963 RepID=A0A7S0GWL3_9EUKA|mmetsp:Transcript_18192/g.28976  ORF Transcript_18192/g.28976 Transcript_18192/m.28976 type:complete len:159 (+) Transcript_18192:118-594(+)
MHHRRATGEGGDAKKFDLSDGKGRLTKEILSEGQGPTIPRGKLAKVLYTGKLESGRELGVSEGDDPVEFVVGNGNVVEGLDEGILTMQQGERAIFYISPELAFGQEGKYPDIPENQSVVYDVELMGWRDPPTIDPLSAALLAVGAIIAGVFYLGSMST